MAEAEQKIKTNDCPIGETATVRGKVRFCRLFHQVQGEELERDVARAKERGQQYPITKPYWKVALSNVGLMPNDPTALNMTERYIAQQVFHSSTHPEHGGQYTPISKAPQKPQVFDASAGDGVAREVVLEGELAQDMDVAVVLEVYGSNQGNNGVGIRSVFLMEPVRYYRPRATTLASLGVTVQPMSREEREAAIAAAEAAAVAEAASDVAVQGASAAPAFAEPALPVVPVYAPENAQTIRTDASPMNMAKPENPFDNSGVVPAINPSNIPGL